MYHILRFSLVFAVLSLCAGSVTGQPAHIQHKVSTGHHQMPTMGRDLWFALPAAGGSGTVTATLYIVGASTGTAHVALSNDAPKGLITIQPFKSATFQIPASWITQSSGRVEDLGIHVWSDDVDISCWVMVHGPKGGEGMYVIPSLGWGKGYVLAAAPAYSDSTKGDFPSFGLIVANTDQTRVTITPVQDIRFEVTNGANRHQIFTNKGVPTQVTLQRGQCIQLKTTIAGDCDNFDLTGTVITSNNPVGVIGGSQYARIPCPWESGNMVFDMIPPVRTWGEKYYTVPFFQPPSVSLGHSASTFLVIGTKKGQKIYRFDANSMQESFYCSIGKYEAYWRNDVAEGCRFTSDAPFLMVQYSNSSMYPDSVAGNGDPAMMVLTAVEQFTKKAMYVQPTASQFKYTNYVNITRNENDKNVLQDGRPVGLATRVYIDGKYSAYRTSGGDLIESDSGVGVSLYGYGYYESYAMPGCLPAATFNSPDTISPQAFSTGFCFDGHVDLLDTAFGLSFPPPSVGLESGIVFMHVDSIRNMSYLLNPDYQEGMQRAKQSYDMSVLDHTRPAILIASAFDQAGNRTTVTSTYRPQYAQLGPPLTDFGVGNATKCVIIYDTLANLGDTTFTYKSLKLVFGDKGFTIDTTFVKNTLQVGERRLIRICFKSITGASAWDTLALDDGCGIQKVVLVGNGGLPDFYVTGSDFGTQTLGTSSTIITAWVHNTSAIQPIEYDSMYVEDQVHFQPIPTNPPNNYWLSSGSILTSIPGQNSDVPVMFKFVTDPSRDHDGVYVTHWCTHSPTIVNGGTGETGWRCAPLIANVVSARETFGSNQEIVEPCEDAVVDVIPAQITAVGTVSSTITKILHSDPTHFKLAVTRMNGVPLARIDTMNEILLSGQVLYLSDTVFLPDQHGTVNYYDTLRAYSLNANGTSTLINNQPVVFVVHEDCEMGVEPRVETKSEQAYLTTDLSGNFLHTHLPEDWSGPVEVEIVNILGVKMPERALEVNTVDVSQLPDGVYFYRLSSETRSSTGKILIGR